MKPTISIPKYDLYHADCLDVMREMEAGSVDAILTDLPYGSTACTWDETIRVVPMWEGVERVLKPHCAFVTTAIQPFTSQLVMSNLEWFDYEWIWRKDRATGHLDAERRPMRKHENILVFSENGHIYNPQIKPKLLQDIRPVSRRAASDCYGKYDESAPRGIPLNMTYPQSVLDINTANVGERGEHPTQKPVSLYRYLVATYTNPGDTVLDICAGSGTTGVACMQLGRKFIGVEIDDKYFEIAAKRIERAAAQELLFTI